LEYKKENYFQAMTHFQQAVSFQKECSSPDYLLNKQQLYHAHLLLSNSALYVAHKAQQCSEELETDVESNLVQHLNLFPLYEMIAHNERYIQSHAFTVITPDETRLNSKEECEELIEGLDNTIILYFSDRQNS